MLHHLLVDPAAASHADEELVVDMAAHHLLRSLASSNDGSTGLPRVSEESSMLTETVGLTARVLTRKSSRRAHCSIVGDYNCLLRELQWLLAGCGCHWLTQGLLRYQPELASS